VLFFHRYLMILRVTQTTLHLLTCIHNFSTISIRFDRHQSTSTIITTYKTKRIQHTNLIYSVSHLKIYFPRLLYFFFLFVELTCANSHTLCREERWGMCCVVRCDYTVCKLRPIGKNTVCGSSVIPSVIISAVYVYYVLLCVLYGRIIDMEEHMNSTSKSRSKHNYVFSCTNILFQ